MNQQHMPHCTIFAVSRNDHRNVDMYLPHFIQYMYIIIIIIYNSSTTQYCDGIWYMVYAMAVVYIPTIIFHYITHILGVIARSHRRRFVKLIVSVFAYSRIIIICNRLKVHLYILYYNA